MRQWRVTRELEGRHPLHERYPLLPGDLIIQDGRKGTWTKVAPGLGITGFVLTPDDLGVLEPADDARWVIA